MAVYHILYIVKLQHESRLRPCTLNITLWQMILKLISADQHVFLTLEKKFMIVL